MNDEIYEGLMHDRLFEQMQTASKEDMLVFKRVCEFEDFFGDMVFSVGTLSHKFVSCKSKTSDADDWFDDQIPLPECIEFFSYDFFTFHAEELKGTLGCFRPKDYSLSVDPAYINDDSVILHEMIHLHEFVIDGLPLFFHDAILFCLYKDLRPKIENLDERIEAHGHILNSQQIAEQGGTHDILFLLKSFDLDLKMGYKVGTVFGYGMADEYTNMDQPLDAPTRPATSNVTLELLPRATTTF